MNITGYRGIGGPDSVCLPPLSCFLGQWCGIPNDYNFGISLMVLDVVFEYGVISRLMVLSSANFGFKKKTS